MTKKQRTVGTWILQLALSVLFIVGGIWMLTGSKGDAISESFSKVFSRDLANILSIVYGVIEIVAGVFLVLRLFIAIGTSLDNILMIIILICWCIAIVLVDGFGLINGIQGKHFNFLSWAYQFATHMLVLGAILKVKSY